MDKIFIEQAKALRRQFFKNAKEVIKHEDAINNYRIELLNLKDEINPQMNEELIRGKFIEIEKKIKSIEDILDPYNQQIRKLEKEADILFEHIKERHPNLTKEDIERELIPHLLEINF
jgi:chromosome segregation ATPase